MLSTTGVCLLREILGPDVANYVLIKYMTTSFFEDLLGQAQWNKYDPSTYGCYSSVANILLGSSKIHYRMMLDSSISGYRLNIVRYTYGHRGGYNTTLMQTIYDQPLAEANMDMIRKKGLHLPRPGHFMDY